MKAALKGTKPSQKKIRVLHPICYSRQKSIGYPLCTSPWLHLLSILLSAHSPVFVLGCCVTLSLTGGHLQPSMYFVFGFHSSLINISNEWITLPHASPSPLCQLLFFFLLSSTSSTDPNSNLIVCFLYNSDHTKVRQTHHYLSILFELLFWGPSKMGTKSVQIAPRIHMESRRHELSWGHVGCCVCVSGRWEKTKLWWQQLIFLCSVVYLSMLVKRVLIWL